MKYILILLLLPVIGLSQKKLFPGNDWLGHYSIVTINGKLYYGEISSMVELPIDTTKPRSERYADYPHFGKIDGIRIDTTFYPTMKWDSSLNLFIERLRDLVDANFRVSDFGYQTGLGQFRSGINTPFVRWNPDILFNKIIEEIRQSAVLYDRYLSAKYDELLWYYQVGYFPEYRRQNFKIGIVP